jgi:hypothetical protein
MRRMVIVLLLILPLVPASAEAVSVRDIIELTKAGLGDNVLLALIEVDGGVFNIDNETLTRLKAAGVSEQVIVALVRSGRTRLPQEPVPVTAPETAPEPQPYYPQPQPEVREVMVPVPYAVPVTVPVFVAVDRFHRRRVVDDRALVIQQPTIGNPFPSTQFRVAGPKLTDTPPQPRAAKPVYWGSGGKLRPDAWGQRDR